MNSSNLTRFMAARRRSPTLYSRRGRKWLLRRRRHSSSRRSGIYQGEGLSSLLLEVSRACRPTEITTIISCAASEFLVPRYYLLQFFCMSWPTRKQQHDRCLHSRSGTLHRMPQQRLQLVDFLNRVFHFSARISPFARLFACAGFFFCHRRRTYI